VPAGTADGLYSAILRGELDPQDEGHAAAEPVRNVDAKRDICRTAYQDVFRIFLDRIPVPAMNPTMDPPK